MKFFKRTNPYRIVIQLAVLAVIIYLLVRVIFTKNFAADFEAYCPYGGLLAFSSFLVNNSLACSMTSAQIAMGALLIAGIILFSKLFCSFICPLGTISELLGRIGEKYKVMFTLKGDADLLMRGLKYALLFLTFYYTIGSSELFCRKFDPYYAAVTGFSSDVNFTWAIIAIVLVLAGSVFIRLFWCKYLCPLGAVSNVFRFIIVFVSVTGTYLLLLAAGVEISYIWPLAIICSIAFFLEYYTLKSKVVPLWRIKRDTEICTNCKLCTKYCPQAIDVANEKDVKHIDCHLCGDCIHVCPEKGALKINKHGKKWLPAAIVIVLVMIGIIAGRSFELPTVSEYWGDKQLKDSMSLYIRSGLKNVKCYGSSTAFMNQMKKVKGVTGVTTYVSTNSVHILFNSQETDTLQIQKAIFTPVTALLRKPLNDSASIKSYRILIENFFDPLDVIYMENLLLQNKEILGLTTEFGCPVNLTVFTNADSDTDSEKISKLIESDSVEMMMADSSRTTVQLNFKVVSITGNEKLLTGIEFSKLMSGVR